MNSHHVRFSDGLILLDTRLGFIPTGCLTEMNKSTDVSLLMAGAGELHEEQFDLQRFWSLEQIGVTNDVTCSDEAALHHFNQTIHCEDGRYVVAWPWRELDPPSDLPIN